jgi:two-component system sensor histidine kinase CpxA
MRSLFLKIFFLFWLTNVMLFVMAFAVFTWFADEESEFHDVSRFALHAATLYERHGKRALMDYLAQLEHTERLRGFLLDAQGRPLAMPLPAHVAHHIEHYPQLIPPSKRRGRRRFINAVEVRLPSGTPYRFVALYRPRRRWGPRPPLPLVRWGLFLAAAALASGLIALFITRPLRQLRATTQQFAEGNLAVRVPAAVHKRADAIGELGREFDHMAARLAGLIETQRQLLRDVSHELRSPLARIQVAATLAEAAADQSAAGDLARIQTEVQRLNTLIERLLTLSRLQSGAQAMERHPLDLRLLLEQVVEDAAYEHHEDGKRVVLSAPEGAVVSGDATALRSAFENVLRNALRYTAPETEVTVTLAPDTHHSSWRCISICDRGPGVPEDHLQHLFEPFFRSDAARDERTGSHGIGLAITRTVIERHGGRIRAHNRPEGGLCVVIELPA